MWPAIIGGTLALTGAITNSTQRGVTATQDREAKYKLLDQQLKGTYAKDLALQQNSQEFQEHMSSTQYQRSVADMKKAGLNPALAVSGGGYATPTAQTGNSSAGSTLSKLAVLHEAKKALHKKTGY